MRTRSPTRRWAGLAALTAAILAGGVRAAAPAPAPPLSEEDTRLVERAVAYLQDLGELKGRFEQTDPRGAVTGGDIYLKRPGRARFVYDPPSSLLVISDGHDVAVIDPRLKTNERYPLGLTPLSLFLAKRVRLDRNIAVTAVNRYSDGFSLTAHDARHKTRGEVTMTFAEAPLRLREWRTVDAQGQVTRVRITSLEPVSGLDPALFIAPLPKSVRGHP